MLFKKICYVTANRSEYAKVRSLIKRLNDDTMIELCVIATGSHLDERYGDSLNDLVEDGIQIDYKLECLLEGNSRKCMVKTSALEIFELSELINKEKPDLGLVVGDRFDILPSAYVFSLLNIPIAHIQGGEKTGTIDDVIRNVITKFSHIHFVANEKAKNNVINMGEKKDYVYNVGCPSFDYIKELIIPEDIDMNILMPYCKDDISLRKNENYFLVMVHPNVVNPEDIDIKEIFKALDIFPNKKVVFYPNNDPFHQDIVSCITKKKDYIKFKHVATDVFMMLLKNCKCLIGNSSSGIREASVFGKPVINIGTRQEGRQRTSNVRDVPCQYLLITKAIQEMMDKKFLTKSIYGEGNASGQIIDIIKSFDTLEYKNIRI